MRRVLSLCLFPLCLAASGCPGTLRWPEGHRQQDHLPTRPAEASHKPSSNLTCGRTIAPDGYQPLPFVGPIAGKLEYSGSLTTWAPIDNETECHIRQLYFTLPDTVYEGPTGNVPGPTGNLDGPDIVIALYKVGANNPVKVPISFDIVSFIDGSLYYRVDAQSPNNLMGDYVMKITVIATPRP